jgi:hypothetical protein
VLPLAIQFLVSVSESHFAAFFLAIQYATELYLLSSVQVMGTHMRQRQAYSTSTVQVANHDVPLLFEVRVAPSLRDINALFV